MSEELERAIRSAFTGSTDHSPGDVIVTQVSTVLLQALADYPEFPKSWLVSPRILGLEMARSLGFRSVEGTIEGRLHDETRRIAARHYQQLVAMDVVHASHAAAIVTWEPSATLLLAIGEHFQLSNVQIIGPLSGGRSGASVLALFATSSQGVDTVLVSKITDDEASFEREYAGHRTALSSWLSPWVIEESKGGNLSDPPRQYFALVSRLAFPPDATKLYPESLHSLLAGGQGARSRDVIESLSKAYCDHLRSGLHARTEVLTQTAFVDRLRSHWTGLTRAWSSDQFWTWSSLPPPSAPMFLDGASLKCNPIWFITRGVGNGATDRYPFWVSFQHGDLNCRNVLVENKPSESSGSVAFRLIDFEKSGELSALFDLSWLALWILQSASEGPEPSAEQWETAADQVTSRLFRRPKGDVYLGSFQLGLDLIDVLASHMWKYVDEMGEADQKGLLQNRIRKQMALTLGACAAAMCGYEVRKYNRLVEEGLDEDGDDDCRRALLWAWLYLRIGASALRDFTPAESALPQTRNVAAVIRNLARARPFL